MTNHWVDMLNADVVLIMGGNPAEDHPISMNWLARAKEQGTYILHVDPRFNRTSSIADVFAKLRSGTDIAFVGGMINYALERNRIHEEYVREYTNASWIVGDDYSFADGLFAGFDPERRSYDRIALGVCTRRQGRAAARPHAQTSALCLSVNEAALLTLQLRCSVPDHRHTERKLP